MRNENLLNVRVSEIRVKRIRVNQGLGVTIRGEILVKIENFMPENA